MSFTKPASVSPLKKPVSKVSLKKTLGWKLDKRGAFRASSTLGTFSITPEGASFMLSLEKKNGLWEDLGSNGSAKTLMLVAEKRVQTTTEAT